MMRHLQCLDTLSFALKHAEGCPYVMTQFMPLPIVVDIIHHICSYFLVGECEFFCEFFCGKNLEIGSGIINFVIQKFIENSATSKLIGILFKLNEIPSKRPFSNGGPRPKGVSSDTGGLQRCGCPQILYLSEFHHIPLMWLHIEAMARVWHTSHELSLFLSYIII